MGTPTSRGLGEGACDWPIGHPHKTVRKKEEVDSGQGALVSMLGTKSQLPPLYMGIWPLLKELPGVVRPTRRLLCCRILCNSTHLLLIPQPG